MSEAHTKVVVELAAADILIDDACELLRTLSRSNATRPTMLAKMQKLYQQLDAFRRRDEPLVDRDKDMT